MRILIACEFSGVVRDAFLARGHDAMSCDLLPTESPGPHYQGDVRDVLDDGWDMMIGHPPCTYLSRAGAHMKGVPGQARLRREAVEFFKLLYEAPIERVAIENPIPLRIARADMGRYDQITYPYEHGDPYAKPICLWLRGLPRLKVTEMVDKRQKITDKGAPGRERRKMRSRFFPGVARAMAVQWAT